MAIYPVLLEEKFKEAVRKIERNPERTGELSKKYVNEVTEYAKKRIEENKEWLISTFCLELYKADYKSLYRDLSKIKLAGLEKEASEEERFELLRCLVDTMQVFLKGDYSSLLNFLGNMCTLDEIMKETDDDMNLPFN